MAGVLGLIAGGVAGLAQTAMGIADRVKAKKEREAAQSFYEQNKYKIPESAIASLGSAERQASSARLPLEDLRRQQISEATATGLGAAQQAGTSASDVLGVLSGLYGSQQRAEQGLALQGAERFDANQQMLRSELGRMSELENQRWQYNVLYPYQQKLATAGQLQERGAQGIGMGLGTIGQAAGAYSQLAGAESQYQNFLNSMGLGGKYAGMSNKEKAQMIGAEQKLQESRKGLYGWDSSYQPKINI